jgi:hypothetical protein
MHLGSPGRWLRAGSALFALLFAALGCDNKMVAADPSQQLWLHQLGTSQADSFLAVAASADAVYTVGGTSGQLSGGGGASQPDGLVAKLDSSGKQIWIEQLGTPAADEWNGVTVDGTGQAYVVGYTGGSFAGQTKVGGNTDALIASLAPDGTVSWARQFGTLSNDSLNAVSRDSSGNLYVAGFTTGTLAGQSLSGTSDCLVAKYGPDGSQLWIRQFGSPQDDLLSSIAVGDDGSIYVAGWATASITGGQPALGGRDAVIYKLDPSGSLIWGRQFGSATDDQLAALVLSDGNLYSAGWTAGSLPGTTAVGQLDGIVASYDLNGGQRWLRQIGTVADDAFTALTSVADGSGVIVGGRVSRGLGGGSWFGALDAIHIKMRSDGQQEWNSQFGSPGNDSVAGLASPKSGVLYSVGFSEGTFAGQLSLGGSDAFVSRYQIP